MKSTIDQIHRIRDVIERALQENQMSAQIRHKLSTGLDA